jgi:hypothetical protein
VATSVFIETTMQLTPQSFHLEVELYVHAT